MAKRIFLIVLFILLTGLSIQAQEATNTPENGKAVPNYAVIYNGSVFNGIQTTFTYTVSGTGQSPSLSHFDLSLPDCTPPLDLIAFAPSEAVSLGVDPTTGIDGIKWDLPLGEDETRTYSLTFLGYVAEGTVTAAVKNGDGFFTIDVGGPTCTQLGLSVEKAVSGDNGASWADADNAPGIEIPLDGQVLFRFTVSNTGTSPLTDLSLSDNTLDVSACVLPQTLGIGESVSCVVGPLDVEEGQHANIATVEGTFSDTESGTISDTDAAHYFGGELDDDVIEIDDDNLIIVIVGPVKKIDGNIIIIYDLEIELSPDDPLLLVIRVGDRVRVQGRWNNGVIIVINVTIIDVDIVIADDVVWRDDGDCNNPPPPWAPAEGWRRKCEGGGDDDRGRGKDDDDDDDDD